MFAYPNLATLAPLQSDSCVTGSGQSIPPVVPQPPRPRRSLSFRRMRLHLSCSTMTSRPRGAFLSCFIPCNSLTIVQDIAFDSR